MRAEVRGQRVSSSIASCNDANAFERVLVVHDESAAFPKATSGGAALAALA